VIGTGPMKKDTFASSATAATPASTNAASTANARARVDGRATMSARTRRPDAGTATDMVLLRRRARAGARGRRDSS
jgi:hypothetical protein